MPFYLVDARVWDQFTGEATHHMLAVRKFDILNCHNALIDQCGSKKERETLRLRSCVMDKGTLKLGFVDDQNVESYETYNIRVEVSEQ